MIGVIAPYAAFKEEVERVARKMNLPIVAEVGALRSGYAKALKMIKTHDVKVIVARASTADFLKEKLTIPVVKIDITNFDVIKTLKESGKRYKCIVLLNHSTDQHRIDIETISDLLKTRIEMKIFEDEQNILEHLNALAQQDAVDAVIGTAECVALSAGRKGMHSVVVFSQEESITEALLRAKESVEHLQKEELKQKHLETIISHAFDGVVSTNEEGLITVCNKVALEYLGVNTEEIIQRSYQNIQLSLVKKLFGDGSNVTRHVITHGSKKFVLNRHRLKGESFVITFQEVERLVDRDSNIRGKLYHRGFFAKYQFNDIIHKSKTMQQTLALAKAYAKSEGNILVYGESGTGKELLAQSIHNASHRAQGPFVAINCAALPENLLESELFGYEDGAFTGAKKGGKPGLFEMAHTGTIFLDEIGEISLSLQARLLRVLQEREVMRIGGDRIIPVDVRVIAATNKNLVESVHEQKFRSDLYYRLNILYLHIPPLRDRMEDLDLLIDYLTEKHGGKPEQITPEMREVFKAYHWPGNIRELENLIERIITIKAHIEEEVPLHIIKQTLREGIHHRNWSDDCLTIRIGRLEEMEAEIVEKLVQKYNGNRSYVAKRLGISRTTLWKKMKEG